VKKGLVGKGGETMGGETIGGEREYGGIVWGEWKTLGEE
jgi:hypothetical protein